MIKTLLPLLLLAPQLFAQSAIRVRVMPPHDAQVLQFQRFDVRVEATAPAGTTLGDLQVTLDGRDITSIGTVSSPSANVKNWTFRQMYLGAPGPRTIAANTGGASAQSRITVRPLHTTDAPQPRAKNVILLVGDGMGIAARTAARVLSKGYVEGKANGTMAMDRLPFNGMLMTSSLNALITDSMAGGHAFATGNKTNNAMAGVFPDNTALDDDNPRIENLPEWAFRTLGMVTGIVSDAVVTDATPASMLAHIQDRGSASKIAAQYVDESARNGLRVLLGGGWLDFVPRSQAGSRRGDERHLVNELETAGFDYVETRTALKSYPGGANRKLLGLFAHHDMNSAFDKLKLGDPNMTASQPDQPFLDDMARAAIDVLKHYPNGFFLMVEGAHIDKQAHVMDAERAIYDVIQLDGAVQVAVDFAKATNGDADPNNDTLVVVAADHETAGLSLPGVGNPAFKGRPRGYVKTYHYESAPNFPDYVDANGDRYPDNPDPDRKLIVNFGANTDHYEDWTSNAIPKSPTVNANGVATANPNDPDRTTGVLVSGVLANGEHAAEVMTVASHTLADVPVSAYGPGAWQFARVSDNTETFFNIVSAILGQYAAMQ